MEPAALEMQWLALRSNALVAGAQRTEVGSSLRDNIVVKLEDDSSSGRAADGDVEEYVRHDRKK